MSRVPMTLRDPFWSDPFFESAWGSGPGGPFAEMRNQMWREHNRMWNTFHSVFGDEDVARPPALERHQDQGNQLAVPEPSDTLWPWFMPPRRWNHGPGDVQNQVMRVQDDAEKFEVSLDTHEFKPDELKINVKENVLQVEGEHEEKSEDGKSYVSRRFVRHYTLPEGCQADKVNSNLSKDGVLMITAPKSNVANHSVPITFKDN